MIERNSYNLGFHLLLCSWDETGTGTGTRTSEIKEHVSFLIKFKKRFVASKMKRMKSRVR